MKWVRRIFFTLLILIVTALILLVAFISPVAKWTIEKYSVEYTGRQVTLDKLTINLLSGNIRANGLKINEAKSNKVFFQCNELYGNIIVHKLLSGEYELPEIKLDHPVVNIIEKGNRFNFSDLIDRFSKKSTTPAEKSKPIKWEIDKVDVISATISYINTSPYNMVKIEHCNINIPGISWNNKVYSINTDFAFASGGEIKGKVSFDKNSWVYNILVDIKQFNVKPFYTYLKDYLKVNSLDGLLSTHPDINGNMHKAAQVAASGNITVDKFSIIDNTGDKLMAVEKMSIQIDSLNTEKNIYRFATINLVQPYLKFEMYKDGYNFNRLSSSPAATTDTTKVVYSNMFLMVADYVQNIVGNYVVSNYNADKFVVSDGTFIFIDYTLYDKFKYKFDALNILSDRISSNSTKIYFDASAILNRSGQLKGNMSVNPKDLKDFSIDCAVKNITIADFNPYSKYYVATPFLSGKGDYTNKTTVVKRQLKSDNLLVVQKIVAGKKDKTYKPQYNMPIRLAVALLKDVHGDIKLDIPVEGSLDDPKFKWGKVVWKVLGNLMVKAASAPFHLLAGAFGGKDEDYKEVDFNYLQKGLQENQQEQLKKLVKALKEKTDLKLELIQVSSQSDEAEALAVYQVKKKYLGIADSTQDQQQQINAVNINDSIFTRYVDSTLQTNTGFESVQEKCKRIIGKENLQASIAVIMQQRIDAISNYLIQQQVPKDRFMIHNTDKPNDPNLGNEPKFVVNISVGNDAGTNNTQQ